MDLHPGKTMNSCKRFFTAPEPSGLFIRLVKSNESENETALNTTEYCPISIVSLTPALTLALNFNNTKASQSSARALFSFAKVSENTQISFFLLFLTFSFQLGRFEASRRMIIHRRM